MGERVKAQPETGFVCKLVRLKYIDTNLKPKAGYAVNSPCIKISNLTPLKGRMTEAVGRVMVSN